MFCRAAVVVLTLAVAGCGGNPASPTPPPPDPTTPPIEPTAIYALEATAVPPKPTCHSWTPPRALDAQIRVTWTGLTNLQLTVHRWEATGTVTLGAHLDGVIGAREVKVRLEAAAHAFCVNQNWDQTQQPYALTVRETAK